MGLLNFIKVKKVSFDNLLESSLSDVEKLQYLLKQLNDTLVDCKTTAVQAVADSKDIMDEVEKFKNVAKSYRAAAKEAKYDKTLSESARELAAKMKLAHAIDIDNRAKALEAKVDSYNKLAEEEKLKCMRISIQKEDLEFEIKSLITKSKEVDAKVNHVDIDSIYDSVKKIGNNINAKKEVSEAIQPSTAETSLSTDIETEAVKAEYENL